MMILVSSTGLARPRPNISPIIDRRRNGANRRCHMATSKLLAAMIGPALLALAASMLINTGSFPALVERISHDPALIMVTGLLTFVAGIAMVRAHNIWTRGWVTVVTVLGWLFVAGGLARVLFPFQLADVGADKTHVLQLAATAAGIDPNIGFVIDIVVAFALGSFLSFKGYSRA
jgi:hypothetical protein